MTNAQTKYLDVALKWGLGNRINGLINGLVVSQIHQRPVRFHWQSGAHCEARFGDLFQAEAGDWLGPLGCGGVELVEGNCAQAVCLPRTLFCPPINKYTQAIRSLTQKIAPEEYGLRFSEIWNSLRWSDRVLARSTIRWSGVAFNVRANRIASYRPPLEQELAILGSGAFIACDSEIWKQYFLNALTDSVALSTQNGDFDLSGRDSDGMINAAADLLVLSRSRLLFVHAPVESTFSIPAIYGAGVPAMRITWRSPG